MTAIVALAKELSGTHLRWRGGNCNSLSPFARSGKTHRSVKRKNFAIGTKKRITNAIGARADLSLFASRDNPIQANGAAQSKRSASNFQMPGVASNRNVR